MCCLPNNYLLKIPKQNKHGEYISVDFLVYESINKFYIHSLYILCYNEHKWASMDVFILRFTTVLDLKKEQRNIFSKTSFD